MGKPPCDKSNVKRGLWTPEEDAKILAYMANHGTGNWTLVPKKAGLNRCGKSCRLRWTNYLRPDLKHDSFTPQEEEIIISLHKAIGSRWSLIAKQLPGRTDNDVKNYWNTKLRKKLSRMGIDPVTHKPFSQIFSDYRNIRGLPSTGNHFGKNINTLLSKQEPSSVLDALQNVNMIMKPKAAELVQDNTSVTNNPSWGFFAQLQVHNQEIIQPHFFTEVTSSCSSSCSSNMTQLSAPQSPSCQRSQAQMAPSSPFSWSEFLIDDPILNMDPQQQLEHEPQGMLSSTLTQGEVSGCKFSSRNEHNFNNGDNNSFGAYNYEAVNGSQVNEYTDASSSSTSSFVDAVLSKDTEMSSQLFALLDGSFE